MSRKNTVSEIGVASWSGHWAGVGLGYAIPFVIVLAILLFWGAIFLAVILVVIGVVGYIYSTVSKEFTRITDSEVLISLAKEQQWLEFNRFIDKKCQPFLLSNEEFVFELINIFIQKVASFSESYNVTELEKKGEFRDMNGEKCRFDYKFFLELKLILSKIDTSISYNKLFVLKIFKNLKSNKLIDGEDIINYLIHRKMGLTGTKVLEGWINKDLRNDEEFILKTLGCFDNYYQFTRALETFQYQLKKNPELICKFEKKIKDAYTLKDILDENSYSCKPLVKLLVKKDGMEIRHAKNNLKDDKEIVMEAVKKDGRALEYLSHNMKNDKEVVMEAVKSDYYALEYASYDLQNDKEVVIEAIKNEWNAMYYMGDELKSLYKDKDLALKAIKDEGLELVFVSDNLKSDKEVVLEAVKNNGMALIFALNNLQNDREIALAAVKNNGMALGYVSGRLQNNKEIVVEAVKNNEKSIKFASTRLKIMNRTTKEAALARI